MVEKWIRLIRAMFTEWWKDDAIQLGAALAYYAAFAIGPLLVLLTSMLGLFYGEAAAEGKLFERLESLVGDDVAKAAQTLLASSQRSKAGGIASVISLSVLFITATGVFSQLRKSLNAIWAVKTSAMGVKRYLFRRFLSILLVFGLGVMLLVLVATDTFIGSAGSSMVIPGIFLRLASFLVSFGVLALFFIAIYKFVPDVDLRWRDLAVGASVTAALFVAGKLGLVFYFNHATGASLYGAAGSLAVVLLSAFFFSQAIFLGAELTKVYARQSS